MWGPDVHYGRGLRRANDAHGDDRATKAVDQITRAASTQGSEKGGTAEIVVSRNKVACERIMSDSPVDGA